MSNEDLELLREEALAGLEAAALGDDPDGFIPDWLANYRAFYEAEGVDPGTADYLARLDYDYFNS